MLNDDTYRLSTELGGDKGFLHGNIEVTVGWLREVGFGPGTLVLLGLGLGLLAGGRLKHVEDIEVLLFQKDSLSLQVVADNLFLLLDGLGLAVYLHEQHLHEVDLA